MQKRDRVITDLARIPPKGAIPSLMETSVRNPAARLRSTVETLPRRTRIAMLKGIERNRIVVGAYTDPRSGGICPMLAAHRSGGRTNVASFARAWDAFTGARRPRLATRREVRALQTYLEMSLLRDDNDGTPIAELANQIRAERAGTTAPAPVPAPEPAKADTAERHRARELKHQPRWAWLRPTRRLDDYRDLLAAAEAELSEQRAEELLGQRPTERV
jgi:hypothetical protein